MAEHRKVLLKSKPRGWGLAGSGARLLLHTGAAVPKRERDLSRVGLRTVQPCAYRAWYASLSASQVGLCNFPAYLKPLTRKYFSKRTLEVLKVPNVSISITVLKALKDRALAGHRKFPAAPRNKARSARGQETLGSSGTSGGAVLWEHPLCASHRHCSAAPRAQQ